MRIQYFLLFLTRDSTGAWNQDLGLLETHTKLTNEQEIWNIDNGEVSWYQSKYRLIKKEWKKEQILCNLRISVLPAQLRGA